MRRTAACVSVLALGMAFAGAVPGQITLPRVIGTNMVLQRGAAVPLWGLASEGEQVTVDFEFLEVFELHAKLFGEKLKRFVFADDSHLNEQAVNPLLRVLLAGHLELLVVDQATIQK